jgi:hypothetical protein
MFNLSSVEQFNKLGTAREEFSGREASLAAEGGT